MPTQERPASVGPTYVTTSDLSRLLRKTQLRTIPYTAAPSTMDSNCQCALVDATVGNITFTLQKASSLGAGSLLCVVKNDASAFLVVVSPASGDSFFPVNSPALSARGDNCLLISDGNLTWYKIAVRIASLPV